MYSVEYTVRAECTVGAECTVESEKRAAMSHPADTLALPAQHPPIYRDLLGTQGHQNLFGAEAAQTRCANLTGLARQMCYDQL